MIGWRLMWGYKQRQMAMKKQMTNFDTALKEEAKKVVRVFHQFNTDQRATHAASRSLGYRQRKAEGQFFYMHPAFPKKGFSTRKQAAMAGLTLNKL